MDSRIEAVTTLKLERLWGESDWHRDWKNAFPFEFRERTFLDRALGYHHRADVFTPCGTAIEFQHSPIAGRELRQREAFYPKMVWMLDGKMFKGFKLLKHLPDMEEKQMQAYEFAQGSNLALIRKLDIEAGIKNPRKLTLSHPELKGIKVHGSLLSFAWRNPHKVWYEASFPIWIDFGGYFIYQLLHRAQVSGHYSYLKVVSKKEFINSFTLAECKHLNENK
ncbi:MAG: competence protein [Pedobacter sp.]|nr:competence protein [Pedobacter sp.]